MAEDKDQESTPSSTPASTPSPDPVDELSTSDPVDAEVTDDESDGPDGSAKDGPDTGATDPETDTDESTEPALVGAATRTRRKTDAEPATNGRRTTASTALTKARTKTPADAKDGTQDGKGKGRATPKQRRTPERDRRTGPIKFAAQSVGELRKVVYPTGSQLRTYFVVVLVFVLFVIAYVSLLDLGLGWLILRVFG